MGKYFSHWNYLDYLVFCISVKYWMATCSWNHRNFLDSYFGNYFIQLKCLPNDTVFLLKNCLGFSFGLHRQTHIVRLNNGAWIGRVNLQVQLELCLLILFCFLLIGTSDYVLINGRARGRWRRFILIILVSNVCVIFLFNYNECAFGVHELSTAFFTGSSLVKDSFAAVNHCYIFHTKPFVLQP